MTAATVVVSVSLMIILVTTAVVTRLRHRAVRQETEAQAWASFQRRIEQARGQSAETPEESDGQEVRGIRPASLMWQSRTQDSVRPPERWEGSP